MALAPILASAQVGVSIDNQVLFPLPPVDTGPITSDLDAPVYVIEAGVTSIHLQPFNSRLVIDTAIADLTCDFVDANGAVVPPPGGSFMVEIDRIATPPGEDDPNVDSSGTPIVREYALDSALGASITQMLLAEGPLLDICSSTAGCDDPPGTRLLCREAGTAVFGTDFEPIVADLTTAWSTSPAGDPPPFEVVAGDAAGTLVKITATNTGALDVGGVSVDISAVLPAQGLSCPQVVTPGTDLSFDASCFGTWTVGDLDGGGSAEIELRLLGDAAAGLGESMTLDATISAPGVADANPGNDTSVADA
ncbi:MAG: hypothetical protein ACPGJE_09465, partial [Wenzhouxiangellaceae bacterium]